MFEERASKGKLLFYVGLSLAVASTIATMVGDTLNLHGQALKWYDFITVGLAGFGLSLMGLKRGEDISGKLPWTGLLEWVVGWAGLMSTLVKTSADAAAGWK